MRRAIAVAFEHPTIESLATWIVEGDPETETGDDDTDWTRTGPIERVDIAADPTLERLYVVRIPVVRVGDAELDAAGLADREIADWLRTTVS